LLRELKISSSASYRAHTIYIYIFKALI